MVKSIERGSVGSGEAGGESNSSMEASFCDDDSWEAGLMTGSTSSSGDGADGVDEDVDGSYALVVLGVHGAGVRNTAINSSVLKATGGISGSINSSILCSVVIPPPSISTRLTVLSSLSTRTIINDVAISIAISGPLTSAFYSGSCLYTTIGIGSLLVFCGLGPNLACGCVSRHS